MALIHDARTGLLCAAHEGDEPLFCFFQGQLVVLDLLANGGAERLAAVRLARGDHEPPAGLQAAWAALPHRFEFRPFAKVKELLLAHVIEWPPKPVADGELDAVEQVEDRVLAGVQPHQKATADGPDLEDGAGGHALSVAQAQTTGSAR